MTTQGQAIILNGKIYTLFVTLLLNANQDFDHKHLNALCLV
jgi:hypothetical protein